VFSSKCADAAKNRGLPRRVRLPRARIRLHRWFEACAAAAAGPYDFGIYRADAAKRSGSPAGLGSQVCAVAVQAQSKNGRSFMPFRISHRL